MKTRLMYDVAAVIKGNNGRKAYDRLSQKNMKITCTSLAALLLAPLTAICAEAESPQAAATRSNTKSDLATADKYQSKGYNVLFIAVVVSRTG